MMIRGENMRAFQDPAGSDRWKDMIMQALLLLSVFPYTNAHRLRLLED
jgi:hypothetical protein